MPHQEKTLAVAIKSQGDTFEERTAWRDEIYRNHETRFESFL
jgi:hypothetical protein